MARKKHLINVHTSTGTTAPTGASLYLGEIAVQHTHDDPALWIKVGSAETSTEYEKFIGLTEITNIFNMSHILGSGYTYSGLPYVNSATTIADAYSALTKEFIDDELVTAAALNDLNDRIIELSGSTGDNAEMIEYIQENEEVVAAALNNLNHRVGTVETHMTGDYIPITGYILACGTTEEELTLRETDTVNEALGKLQKQSLDNEEAIAAGLNDLNQRVSENAAAIARNTGVTALSGAVRSLSAATYNIIGQIGNGLNRLSSATRTLSSATQSLSASVMSISAKTSGILTVNVNGEEQGKYSPSANTTLDLEVIQEVTGADVLLTGYELASGTTEEELAILATDTVNEAFGKIQKQNYDNEAVIAGALNDLDERIRAIESGGSGDVMELFEYLSGVVEDNELVTAAALNDLNGKIEELSGNSSVSAITEDVESLSAAVVTKELAIAASLNDLNDRVNDLSDESDLLSQQIQELSGSSSGGGTDTACTETGHYSPATTASTLGTTATTTTSFIKGIRIDSKNHAISVATGTVVTAQTQLSTATTGTGNVMTNISVSNHQITKNFGMTIPSWATASTKPSYTASEVGALPTGTTLDNVADGSTRKLSDYSLTGHTHDYLPLSGGMVNGNITLSGSSAHLVVRNNNGTKIATLEGDSLTLGNKIALLDPDAEEIFGPNNVRFRAKDGTVALLSDVPTESSIASSGFTKNALTSYTETDPTVPSWAKAANKPTYTASEVGALSAGTTLDGIADGSTRKLSNYATTGTVNTHTATTIANGTSSQMHLPTVSASDNGKILLVKNGAWSLETPVTVYNGSSAPNPNMGNDGDIYLQTS